MSLDKMVEVVKIAIKVETHSSPCCYIKAHIVSREWGKLEMGHIWVEAVIANPFTGKSTSVKALVDTGAIDTVIPRRIAEELQLPVTGKSVVLTAKGRVELDECIGVMEMMGKRRTVPMLISDEISFMLIGVTTLELLRLEIDPVTGKLKESIAFLF
jgi:clan AA aspartic protease